MGTDQGHFIITIDGPAGSGKSTTAKRVAGKLGWLYLDTGAMYRALTVKVLEEKIPLEDREKIGRLAQSTRIELVPDKDGTKVAVDGKDVTTEIRMPDVDRAVGPVCEIPEVREVMVSLQRKLGEKGRIVAEGRDMGTVVFPRADVKFFMVATLEERARRRYKEMRRRGITVSMAFVREAIEKRDRRDTGRLHSPLLKADDAVLINTSEMRISDQVKFVLECVYKKLGRI
jgi:cytidylate kinase